MASFLVFTLIFFLITSEGALGGKIQSACAFCKYRRQGCRTDCILRPYFPGNQSTNFQNVHRLYRNLEKMFQVVEPNLRGELATSIIFESAARAAFPFHGCLPYIWSLLNQIQIQSEELARIRNQLAEHNSAAATASNPAADLRSSQFMNTPTNLTSNTSNYCPRVANDGAIDLLSGGEYFGNFGSVTETRPREITHAEQLLPNSNDLSLLPAIEHANTNNNENATDWSSTIFLLNLRRKFGFYDEG